MNEDYERKPISLLTEPFKIEEVSEATQIYQGLRVLKNNEERIIYVLRNDERKEWVKVKPQNRIFLLSLVGPFLPSNFKVSVFSLLCFINSAFNRAFSIVFLYGKKWDIHRFCHFLSCNCVMAMTYKLRNRFDLNKAKYHFSPHILYQLSNLFLIFFYSQF